MSDHNPHSTYDILYKGMSEEDRARLQEDVKSALLKGSDEIHGVLTKEVEKAVTQLYSQLIVNPWRTIIEENSGRYEFIEAIRKSIWKSMLESAPDNVSEFELRELMEAWQKSYPVEFNAAVGASAASKIESLTEQLRYATLPRSHSY